MRVCINLCVRLRVSMYYVSMMCRKIYIYISVSGSIPSVSLRVLVALGGCCCFKCHSDDNFLCVRTWCRFSSYRVPELYFGGVTGGATASISHAISINERGGRERGTTRDTTLFPGYPTPRACNRPSCIFVLFRPSFLFFLFF